MTTSRLVVLFNDVMMMQFPMQGSKVQSLLALLDEQEIQQMKSVVRRAKTLAECAQDRGVRLMIDAEQTYFQPAIRHMAVNVLMPEFNLSSPVIYNTVQCYLRGAETVLQMDLELSRLSGFCYGVKLVRGAYMEQENKLAKTKVCVCVCVCVCVKV